MTDLALDAARVIAWAWVAYESIYYSACWLHRRAPELPYHD